MITISSQFSSLWVGASAMPRGSGDGKFQDVSDYGDRCTLLLTPCTHTLRWCCQHCCWPRRFMGRAGVIKRLSKEKLDMSCSRNNTKKKKKTEYITLTFWWFMLTYCCRNPKNSCSTIPFLSYSQFCPDTVCILHNPNAVHDRMLWTRSCWRSGLRGTALRNFVGDIWKK